MYHSTLGVRVIKKKKKKHQSLFIPPVRPGDGRADLERFPTETCAMLLDNGAIPYRDIPYREALLLDNLVPEPSQIRTSSVVN